MILTPGHLTQRSEFYHQVGRLVAAGLGLIPALEQLRRNPPGRSYHAPIGRVLVELAHGSTLSEALAATSWWLPKFDTTLIDAGERSGRLDQSFRLLADYYGERARNVKVMISALLYPAFLLHLLVVVMTIVAWRWFPTLILLPAAGLASLYVLIAVIVFAAQSSHGGVPS